MRILRFWAQVTLLLAAGVALVAGAQSTNIGKVTLKGTSVLAGGSHPVYHTAFIAPGLPEHDLVDARASTVRNAQVLGSHSTSPALSIPAPSPDSVSFRGANVPVAFSGLSTVDTALTNGFVVSPPDQGLCAGRGLVVEIINLAVTVYSNTGTELTSPLSANAFFGADPATTFLSDPRCYYDASTQRWFFSMTNVLDTTIGRSNLLLAVSQTNDPTGEYIIYSIDTTDDGNGGTPADPGCASDSPCYGDQPLLGADAYGVYLSTNEFGVFSHVFNGAEIYALSKSALEAGTITSFVHIGGIPLAEGTAYSVQPASSPDLSTETAPGVEYFLSALDFSGSLDNRIAVWALTNTESLNSKSPNVSLLGTIIGSEVYGQPPVATQKMGPYPLGQFFGEPEEALNTNDDRMNNVVFASDHLWAGLNTIVTDGKNINAGIAYFFVKPSVNGGKLSANLQGQGYISVEGNSVLFPGIGVTAGGTAAAAFTVSGPSYFPSAAYAHLTPSHATGVNIVALGQAAQDDFSGYPEFGGDPGVARWGDYSYGVADGDSLWLATEFIPGTINSLDFFTNFGTEVFKVNMQ